MNDIIHQLISLQSIDLEIDAFNDKIKAEEDVLESRNNDIAEREATISDLQLKIDDLEKELRTLEAEVADDVTHVKSRQAKMMQVQTGREQTAILKEIEDGKRNVKEKEEKLVSIMEESEVLKQNLQEQQNLLKEEKKSQVGEAKKAKSAINALNKKKKSQDKKRQERAEKVDESLLKKYDILRERRNGLAVANVLQGVCQGCYMSIPPQKYNLLLQGNQFLDCPTCQRITYHRPVEEES